MAVLLVDSLKALSLRELSFFSSRGGGGGAGGNGGGDQVNIIDTKGGIKEKIMS